MEILKNINIIKSDDNQSDYIRQYFIDYFNYEYDSDIKVYLGKLTAEITEYTLFVRYKNMIEEKPNIYSGFLKYENLVNKKPTYGLYHSLAKSLILYPNGWEGIGKYFTDECKQRFKIKYKKEFDFIYGLIKSNIDINKYRISFKPIIDYIELILKNPIINKYSFNKKGETRNKWYTIEEKENQTNYKIKIYDINNLYIKTIINPIPKESIYTYINY